MNHLRRLGNQISIPIPPDEDGFTGRECPVPECLGYFKIQSGTGLKGEGLPCHCPYCEHVDGHDKFWTKEQIEYVESVALNRVTEALLKDLKAMEFDYRPRGGFGIGISMRVEGHPHPIRYYREKQLETVVVRDHCTLRYAIYGVFAFCPDCGTHNSQQILDKNLELAEKEVALAATVERELADYLIADALENTASAFDGFGRETCRVYAVTSSASAKAENLSFQNLANARQRIQELFGFDLAAGVETQEWDFVCLCFQKRHLLAHKMGVVDETYLKTVKDPQTIVGRKVFIKPDEVIALISVLKKLGAYLVGQLPRGLHSGTSGRETES